MTPRRRLLQIPPGTEGFFQEEAFRHRRIVHELDQLLTGWGYLPAETPVFDFFDIYKPLLDDSAAEKVYRMMDRDGDLLLLRNDITLFLAKQMGVALTVKDLPLRVWYADSILRHQQSEDISKNEFYQLGAELIGQPGLDGDGEILLLVCEILDSLKLAAVIHLGSAGLVHECAAGLELEEAKEFFNAVSLRDRDSMRALLAQAKAGDPALLLELFDFIGSPGEFNKIYADVYKRLPLPQQEYLKRLIEVTGILDRTGHAERLRIDLSETGSQAYHSGIVFQAYLGGVDSAFLSGGRYDKLLDTFGFDTPSVGFSLMLRKIETLVGEPERFAPPARAPRAEGADLAERYLRAAEQRGEGRIVCL